MLINRKNFFGTWKSNDENMEKTNEYCEAAENVNELSIGTTPTVFSI